MVMAKCRECGIEISDEAKTCPKCGISKPVKKTSLLVKILAVIFGFAILSNVISGMSGGSSTSSGSATAPIIDPKTEALNVVKLNNFSWYKGGFDNIMMLNTVIKNNGSHDVKDIEIECTHSSNSGTRIDSNKKVIFELIKPGKSVRIKDFNMGFIHSQASSTNYKIIGLVLL